MMEVLCRIVIARKLTFFTYIETLLNTQTRDMDILILSTYMNDRLKSQTDRLKTNGNSVYIQLLRGVE